MEEGEEKGDNGGGFIDKQRINVGHSTLSRHLAQASGSLGLNAEVRNPKLPPLYRFASRSGGARCPIFLSSSLPPSLLLLPVFLREVLMSCDSGGPLPRSIDVHLDYRVIVA